MKTIRNEASRGLRETTNEWMRERKEERKRGREVGKKTLGNVVALSKKTRSN